MTARKWKRPLLYLASYALLFVWLVPLLWMVLASFKPEGSSFLDIWALFQPPYTWDNFVFVMRSSSMWRWLWNSLLVAVVTTLGTLVLTSLAAYSLSTLRFRGRGPVYWLVIAGMMIPLEATIIPMYRIMVDWGLVDSYSALILPGLAAPLGVILLKQFFDAIPRDLVNAAKMDGAGHWKIYRHVFLPLSRSAMASLGIFTFLASWNSYLWPYLAMNSEEMMTLPVGVPLFQTAYTQEMARPMAANLLASLPVLAAFLLFQRHIIKGIAMTGIK